MTEKAFKGCGCTKIIDGELVATGDHDCIAPKLVEIIEAFLRDGSKAYIDRIRAEAKSALDAAYGEQDAKV